jgi:hypothetical protein
MKIKALITTLVLGTSSVALAAPAYQTTPYSAPAVRDHRTPAPAPKPAPQYSYGWQKPFARPVLLANDTRVNGWSNVNVAQGARMFTKLELKAQSGRTDLDRVLITFGNGQRQVVQLNGRRDGIVTSNKSLTIDLDGGARHIKSVMLIGNSGRRASIDIVAV